MRQSVLLTLLLLSGCIALPVPVPQSAGPKPDSRTNIGDKPPAGIVFGETTRTQVLLMLGEPDGRAADDGWFTYGSLAQRGGVHWLLFVATTGGGGAFPIDDWDTSRRLTVRFDARGVVSGVALDQRNCNGNCLEPRGEDLAKADAQAAALAAAGPVVATYKGYHLMGPFKRGCDSASRTVAGVEVGGPLTLGERGLVWQRPYDKWVNLSFEDVRSVSPPVRHAFHTWVAIEKKDGSCLYFRVLGKGVSQEDFWSAMQPHVPAATPRPDGTAGDARPAPAAQH